MRFVLGTILITTTLLFACYRDEAMISSVPIPIESPTPLPETLAIQAGPVKDELSAVKIALKAWLPVYGQAKIDEEKPYYAFLRNGVWTVEGYLPPDTIGGTVFARILQKDGRILEIGHGE